MQNIASTFMFLLKILENNNIEYMIVGSVASMIYGEPRLTHDMDLVLNVLPGDASKIESILSTEDFYCPPLEVLRSEITHRGQFNLIHHESGLKIDLMIRKDTPHAKCEFLRKTKTPFLGGSTVFVATPEDIIIKKLDYYRQGGSEKHINDIRGILSQTQIDLNYLNLWLEKLNLIKEWEKVN